MEIPSAQLIFVRFLRRVYYLGGGIRPGRRIVTRHPLLGGLLRAEAFGGIDF